MTDIDLTAFMAKVSITEGCWVWTASTRNGYGQFRTKDRRTLYAHRIMFEHHNGWLPSGRKIVVDHQCNNRLCVNPLHLQAITQSENARRAFADMCRKNLHPLDAENTGIHHGRRFCKTCRKIARSTTDRAQPG